jgi:superfamily I DNA and/or RNA helicase
MKNSKLKILLEKLSNESRRSPFLNCLQGKSSGVRFDVKFLDLTEPFFSRDLLRGLITDKSISIDLRIQQTTIHESTLEELQLSAESENLDSLLRKLWSNNENIRLENGRDALYVGFPILSHFDPIDASKNFIAPLILWKIDLKPGTHFDKWVISREEEGEIRLNYTLRNWLIDNNMRIPKEPNLELIENGNFSYNQIEQYLNDIAEIFSIAGDWKKRFFEINTLGPDHIPFQNLQSIQIDTHRIGFQLHLSSVIGLFKANKESIIQDIKFYSENLESADIESVSQALFPQISFGSIYLDPAQQNALETLKEGKHTVIHGPPGTGKSTVLTGIATCALANEKTLLMVCEKKAALDVIANRLNELGLNNQYALIQDVTKDRRNIVSKARLIEQIFFENTNTKPKEINQIDKLWLEYNKSFQLFAQLINEPVFEKMGIEELLNIHLKEYNEGVKIELNSAIIENLLNQPEIIDSKFLATNKLIENQSFLRYWDFANEITNKQILENPIQFKEFIELECITNENNILVHGKIKCILELLCEYQDEHEQHTMQSRFIQIFNGIFSKRRRAYLRLIKKYEFWKKEPLKEQHFAQYFKLISKELELHEAYHSKLNYLKTSDDNYKIWSELYLELIQIGFKTSEKTLNNLIKYENPTEVFRESFFLTIIRNRLLELDSPFKMEDIIKTIDLLNDAQSFSLKWAKFHSINRAKTEIKRANDKYGFRRLYNLRGSNGSSRNSLHAIATSDLELFKSVFPIVLCTPEVASTLFKGGDKIFDLVVFDEASQLKIEDSYAAMLKGKTIVVSGDKHQMPPSSWFESENDQINQTDDTVEDKMILESFQSESLLDFCIEHPAFSENFLKFHYRSEHADLINFSNAAFYGNLIPLPGITNEKPFEYHQVNGIYQKQSNEIEANSIVEWLNNYNLSENEKQKSIGIVTLNIKQRDLIIKLLMHKRRIDNEFDKKLIALETEGLFIRNLENIQGDERDIIILSTTFGPNEEGIIRHQFGKLGTRQGYRLLNVLITRAKYKNVVFTSIPLHETSQCKELLNEKKGNWGYGLLYAYLKYVYELSEAPEKEKSYILSQLSKYCESTINEIDKEQPKWRLELLHKITKSHIEWDNSVFNQKIGYYSVDLLKSEINKDAGYLFHGVSQLSKPELLDIIHRRNYFEKQNFKYKTIVF